VAPYCGCGAGGMRFATHAAQWTRNCTEEEEEEWFMTWGSGGASHREGDGRHEGGVTASDATCRIFSRVPASRQQPLSARTDGFSIP
jgi:hypothetical protein